VECPVRFVGSDFQLAIVLEMQGLLWACFQKLQFANKSLFIGWFRQKAFFPSINTFSTQKKEKLAPKVSNGNGKCCKMGNKRGTIGLL
jgi:hypothetical protein